MGEVLQSEQLNRWLTLAANSSVLLGIGLLIIELRQNQEIMRAQTRNEITQGELALLGLPAENPLLAEVIVKSNAGEDLSAGEEMMYIHRSESVFRLWQNVHYQGRNGMYDEDEFAKHLDTMKMVLGTNPGLVEYWCDTREVFPIIFATDIDRMIPPGSC